MKPKQFRLSMFSLITVALACPVAAEDWRMYLHDLAHSSTTAAESGIGIENAATLRQRWRLSLGRTLAAAPTVVNGVLYFGDWAGYFHAVNAVDGSIIWQQFVGISAEPEAPFCMPATGVSSQAVVADNVVYVGGGDSAIYALDVTSGKINWRVPLADPNTGAYLWSSIVPSGNALYIGIASLGDCPLTRGAVVRLDLRNRDQPLIRYLTTPDELGAGVWSTPAIDAELNKVYVTSGTGSPEPKTGIWGSSFLAMDGDTLAIQASFGLPTYSADIDIEWGSSPTLLRTASGTKLVAATGKDGILYVLNRDDMSIAWTKTLAVACVDPERGCGSISTPAFDGKLLYVGGGVIDPEGFDDGSIYAINPTTRQTVWVHSLADPVLAPVTVANGIVFVATTGGLRLYVAATGEPLWDDNGYGALFSQPVVVDGVIYSTYVNGDVVAWAPVSTVSPPRAGRRH